mgnify:CR=1 FL=1
MLVNGKEVKLRGACRHDVHPLLGRMTTTMRWLITLPAGPGAILGGWMAEHVSMRSSLLSAGLGTLAVAAVAFARPHLKTIRQLPELNQSKV